MPQTAQMASTSNVTHGGDGEPENPVFSLDLGLIGDLPLRRNVPPLYKYVDALRPASPNSVDGSRAHWTPGGEADANSVVMQILRLPLEEMNGEINAVQIITSSFVAITVDADLLLIYPKAKVRGDRITTKAHIFVLKRLLYNRKVSGDDMSGVPFSDSFARLLRRLCRELRSAPDRNFKFACTPDPLYDLLRDIEETDGEIPEASDEETDHYVYVKGNIDLYVECLLAAASELMSTC